MGEHTLQCAMPLGLNADPAALAAGMILMAIGLVLFGIALGMLLRAK